jgi:hypothetical protein
MLLFCFVLDKQGSKRFVSYKQLLDLGRSSVHKLHGARALRL